MKTWILILVCLWIGVWLKAIDEEWILGWLFLATLITVLALAFFGFRTF